MSCTSLITGEVGCKEGFEAVRGRIPRVTVNFRFQVSPTQLMVDETGRVSEVELVHNDLVFGETRSQITATDRRTVIPSHLFIRSVGYRGRALDGVPFNDRSGLVPSDELGRVTCLEGKVVRGLYVSGWMRRGPSGVIGTNKKDAQEVAKALLEDDLEVAVSSPEEFADFQQRLVEKGAIGKADWALLDKWETDSGQKLGKPRRKLVTMEDVKRALAEARATAGSAG